MKDRTLYTYEIASTLAALLTFLWLVASLVANEHSSMLPVAFGSFVVVVTLVLLTSIPMVYLHDRGLDPEVIRR